MSGPLVAIVLAAGASTRFDAGSKQRAEIAGRSLLSIAVDAAVGAGCFDAVLVVAGAEPVDDLLADGVEIVVNERWDQGQATSLAAGLDAAGALGARAVVVGLCDQPGTGPEAWRAVATSPAITPIVIADYGATSAPPVRLDASIWPDLPRTGDEGARSLWRGRPDLVTAVACPGNPDDIDTVEDLERWN